MLPAPKELTKEEFLQQKLSIWNKQLNLPLQYLPPGIQEAQRFVKQTGENLDYIITAKFFIVAYVSKNSCLLENRQSLAQLLPSLSTGTNCQQRRDWAAMHLYWSCLFWFQRWFCPKLWKSAILPESHTGIPLPVNHSVNMYSLAECYPYVVWSLTA